MTYQAPTTSLRPKSRPTTVDSSPRPPSRPTRQPSTPKDNSSFGSFVSPTNTGSGGLASPTKPKKQEEKPSMVDRFWSLFDSTGGTVPEDDTTSSSERALSFYDSVDMTIPEVPQVSEFSELAPATTDPYVGAVGTGNRGVAPNTMDSYLQGDADIEAIMPPAAPSGLMSPDIEESPVVDTATVSEVDTFDFDQFYLDIGVHGETDHGSTPKATNDAKEASKPVAQRSKDVGYGHKVKAAENTSGTIHGIPFKNTDGSYIPLTQAQKGTILEKDMDALLSEARVDNSKGVGWDTKLSNIGTSWDDLDSEYQAALTSLAYNVGGSAGRKWTNVLTAAKDKNLKSFALGLRRKDAGSYTAGMDNRVMKELYYSGLISNRSEVSDKLPLATSGSGVPN